MLGAGQGGEWISNAGIPACTVASAHIFLVSHDGHLSGAATQIRTARRRARSSVRGCTRSMLHLTATDVGAVALPRDGSDFLLLGSPAAVTAWTTRLVMLSLRQRS